MPEENIEFDLLPESDPPDSHELDKEILLARLSARADVYRSTGASLKKELIEEFNEYIRDDDRERLNPSELQDILLQVKDVYIKALLEGFYK